MTSLDLTRQFARIDLADVPARLIGPAGGGPQILDNVLDNARVLLAAEHVGAAGRCLEMSVDYAKTRFQFGRPIGSFQAIKHLCADMLIQLEGARAAVGEAVAAESEHRADLRLVAAVAFVESARAFYFIVRENIHVHGGIGFTWEHLAHFYFRRAKSNEMMMGGPAADYETVLRLLGV
jgi:alkylation response protein AidB-like acyl-CoA dehydrogenase